MQANSQKLENIRTTILSLLLARKGGCTLRQLDNDYCEVEGTNIPWKDFGYISLLNFLHAMSKNVQIENKNNTIILKGIATDKSKHVSRLVAGQKSQSNLTGRKVYKPSHYYPKTAPPKIRIPAEILLKIINLINEHPDGMNKDYVLQEIQSLMPFANIKMQDMEDQFRELSHKIFLTNNKIFPIQSKTGNSDYLKKPNGMSSSNFASESYNGQGRQSPVVTVGGDEDSDVMSDYDDDDDLKFIPASNLHPNKSTINIKSTSNFIKETVSKCQDQIIESTSDIEFEQSNSCYLHDYDFDNNSQLYTEYNNNVGKRKDCENDKNGEILINDRVKFRLEKLIQNRPNGIWCAELPEVYLEEYKVSLNYMELGFNSVREFASQLPEIFHCVQLHDTGDFMLYYAKMEIPTNKLKGNHKVGNLAQLHQIYETSDEEALPVTVSLDVCKELIPDDTMTIGECVGYISVTDLRQDEKPYIEVIVVEVFTPSFFWIQLRKKQRTFKKFMNELHNFYVTKHEQYTVPPLVLEKGLNCACMYNGLWHRGIIKIVKPDLQVTVMFYDYGTLKTYPAEEIHYLHRMFSYLPAQAIPCGLVNTKPYKGSKWSRSATHHFAIRTQMPLIATIASINVEDNSMMVTLTDTSEEEDVHINDWLVEQKLAEHGKMVCTKYRNFPFRYYLECQERHKQKTEILKVCMKDKSTQCDSTLFENYSRNKITLCNLNAEVTPVSESSSGKADIGKIDSVSHKDVKKLEFLKSCSRLQSNVPKDICNYTLNSGDESPKKLKSLYKKLLNFKQISHSNKINNHNNYTDNTDNNNNTEINKISSYESSNKSVEQELQEESPKLDNINEKFDHFSHTPAISVFNNNIEVNEISNNKYDILHKFSNIPKAYAHHFHIQDSEDEMDLHRIKRSDICTETNEETCIDWSIISKNTQQKVENTFCQNVIKTTHEFVPRREDNITLPEHCFLKAVYNSSHFATNDKDICWSLNGNINKIHDVPRAILQNIRNCMTSDPENVTVAISKKILETLAEKESSVESLELITTASRNITGVQSVDLLQECNSINSDNKVVCPQSFEHGSGSQENYYCCMKVLPFKYKLLEKLSTMKNITHNNSDLDSDDLSDSKKSVQSSRNIDNSDGSLNLENIKNDANTRDSRAIDFSSEIDFNDFSDPIETKNTDVDTVKLEFKSTANEYELYEKQTSLIKMVPSETSISENNTESTEGLISTGSISSDTQFSEPPLMLEEASSHIKATKESEQTKRPLSINEKVPFELKLIEESSTTINEMSDIPVFNDVDIESDEDEWDVDIEHTEFLNILRNNFGFTKKTENQLDYKSDSSLKITEIDGTNAIELEDTSRIEAYQSTEDSNHEIINLDDKSDDKQDLNNELNNWMDQPNKSEDQASVIYFDKNSNINDRNIPNLTNIISKSGKIQGKAKSLIEMLNKAKLMKKDCVEK